MKERQEKYVNRCPLAFGSQILTLIMMGQNSSEEYDNALIYIFSTVLVLLCTALTFRLKYFSQRNAQLTKDLADATFRLDLAQQSVSILESELERKTFQAPAKSMHPLRKAEEKIPAHYGADSAEDRIQNYLQDTGAMLIQEDQVIQWMDYEKKVSLFSEELKELQAFLNSASIEKHLSKQEMLKTTMFLVQKMTEL